jgi:transcriptional regulator with XRE-family HTH domain
MGRTHDENRVRLRREQIEWTDEKDRPRRGMLLVELAKRSGRSPALISMIENGFVPTKLGTAVAVADALDSTPVELWPGDFTTEPEAASE